MHNEDNNITIVWDMPVNTDRTVTANRPDIVVKYSVNSTCKLIDMTVPSYKNIALKKMEKKSKYKDLELKIQRMCQMKTVVIPVVVGALGTVKKAVVENIKKVFEAATVTEIKKICMLGSARIIREVLSIWTEWLTQVTDAIGAWFAPGWCTKRTPAKTVIEEMIIMMITIIIIIRRRRRMILTPSWLVSSVGRALHRYRKGHWGQIPYRPEFFFRLSFHYYLSSVHYCEDRFHIQIMIVIIITISNNETMSQ